MGEVNAELYDADVSASRYTYQYEVMVDPIALLPGTNYWLSVVNDISGYNNLTWIWTTSSGSSGNAYSRFGDFENWTPESSPIAYAFQLEGEEIVAPKPPVPEPATLLLMGIGLAGLGFARRRRLNA